MNNHSDICEDEGCCGTVHEDCVQRARGSMPEAGVLADLGEFFKVLTDPTRLRILYALGSGELCVCDLAAAVGASESSVSHHLAHLRRARLARGRRDGRTIYYALDDEHVRGIVAQAKEHLEENHGGN